MQASAKGLTRDTKRGGKYMAIDSGDDEEGVVEVESISSDDEEMDASGSRSGSSSADSQMNSTKPPSPSPDPEDRLDNNPQEETVAPESDDVGNESANSSRTIVDNEGSEAEPVLQGESSDRESIHPAPTMCRADAAVGAEIDMAVKMEEQEEEVPDITGASVTTTDQAMPLSATLDNEGPFLNTVSGRSRVILLPNWMSSRIWPGHLPYPEDFSKLCKKSKMISILNKRRDTFLTDLDLANFLQSLLDTVSHAKFSWLLPPDFSPYK